jgi:hypothetical protein
MNIRCIFGHKWEISKQVREVEYNLPKFSKKGTWNGSGKKVSTTIFDDIRICKRCYKKQRAMYSLFNYNNKHRTPDWRNDELTKDELRDKKLKELGI